MILFVCRTTMDGFNLGINYFPSSKAMYWWKSFDLNEVKADFNRIQGAGFDSVRIFLIWEDFQPAPKSVSYGSMENLKAVADVALSLDIRLIITLYTGHMSGVNWIPEWALEDRPECNLRFRTYSNGKIRNAKIRNWYEEEEILAAQEFLAYEVARFLGDHEAILAWDIGNENSNCTVPSSKDKALTWLERITAAIRKVSKKPITIGLHAEDIEEDRKLGPAEAAMFCDFLCMHGYPIYVDYSVKATDAFILPFLGLVTKWLGGGKEVFFEEFGLPNIPAGLSRFVSLSEEETAAFISESLELLYNFGFIGAMIWCYSDYCTTLWDKPPFDDALHERHFGLWYPFGGGLSEKKAVQKVREFRSKISQLSRKSKESFDWIDVEREKFYEAPKTYLRHLYDNFRSFYGLS
ncbi:MAG: cellulase family glycosylhydrolase [Pyrinomonadaceae bacterium]|nr:cellulase family glycosylhydrolase [Pyrinomonadaceae bacterium]MCX7640970.1 cellulase family glycosylhydrolase [Pyrinomonadaceae bacterium]MDW8305107.1 cellulase family glycosylhydrolase [Acidobacteriota bacterium]